jgi:hypothetical protein
MTGFRNTGFLSIHARVYAEAHRFSIKDLKELCVEKFEKEALISWKTDAFYHFTTVLFALDHLYEVYFADTDWYIIRDGTFEKVIIEIVIGHLQEIREDARFKELVTSSDQFSSVLLRRILEY